MKTNTASVPIVLSCMPDGDHDELKVDLPGSYSGQEILAAFDRATTLHLSGKERLKPEHFLVKNHPDDPAEAAHRQGVAVFHHWFGWLFWGRKWHKPLCPAIVLHPLSPNWSYNTVTLDLPCGVADDGPFRLIQETDLREILEGFEKELKNLRS